MKNHFHLLLRLKDNADNKRTSQNFSNLFNAYAKAINKAYSRTGSLFQTRFSRRSIEDQKYLERVIIYIHRNPEHHHFSKDFSTYQFSSYQKILSREPTFLARDHVLELFGSIQKFIEAHGIIEQSENDSKILEL